MRPKKYKKKLKKKRKKDASAKTFFILILIKVKRRMFNYFIILLSTDCFIGKCNFELFALASKIKFLVVSLEEKRL